MASRAQRAAESDTIFDRRGRTTKPPVTGDRRGSSDAQDGVSGALKRAEVPHAARKRRATSDGREPLVVYMPPDCIKALKIAAVEHDTTASAIVTGIVDVWLRARSKHPTKSPPR